MKDTKWYIFFAIAALTFPLASCVSIPEAAKAVSPFDQEKYLGKWYEIARLDFKWERNLNNVTARYSLNADGTIKVDNQGYDTVKNEWKQSIGKAKKVNKNNEGRLKVSFFGPFYSGYNIISLDNEYKYALVAGDDLKNLWILSRSMTVPEDIKNDYLQKAKAIGYNIDDLIFVEHNQNK